MSVLSLAPAPLTLTMSESGKLTIQFTPGPEPNDIDYYEVSSGLFKFSIKANVRPLTCTFMGPSDGHRYHLNAKACLASGQCSEPVLKTVEIRPAGMSK